MRSSISKSELLNKKYCLCILFLQIRFQPVTAACFLVSVLIQDFLLIAKVIKQGFLVHALVEERCLSEDDGRVGYVHLSFTVSVKKRFYKFVKGGSSETIDTATSGDLYGTYDCESYLILFRFSQEQAGLNI